MVTLHFIISQDSEALVLCLSTSRSSLGGLMLGRKVTAFPVFGGLSRHSFVPADPVSGKKRKNTTCVKFLGAFRHSASTYSWRQWPLRRTGQTMR